MAPEPNAEEWDLYFENMKVKHSDVTFEVKKSFWQRVREFFNYSDFISSFAVPNFKIEVVFDDTFIFDNVLFDTYKNFFPFDYRLQIWNSMQRKHLDYIQKEIKELRNATK